MKLVALLRTFLRAQVSRGRAAALGAVSLVGLLLAFAIRGAPADRRFDAATELVDVFGLGLLVPITALLFAAAVLGDPVEDRTLVYLWMRPVRRATIALAAVAATLIVVLPAAVLPTVAIAAVASGSGELLAGAAAAAAVGVAAYAGLFTLLGLLVRRALAWGLAYVLIWEGFVARSGTGASRLSILAYARSLGAEIAGTEPPSFAASTTAAVAVPLVVALLALGATALALARVDVD